MATKWEETVLTGEQMSEEIQKKTKKWSVVNPAFIEDIANIIAKKQAQLSFSEGEKAERERSKEFCSHCDTPLLKEGEQYERIKQEGIREVVEWLRQYSIHGKRVALEIVLIDLDAHSPYGKAFLKGKGIDNG